jgi:hypothetical protein
LTTLTESLSHRPVDDRLKRCGNYPPDDVHPDTPNRQGSKIMDDFSQNPEELIAGMSTDELQELLAELGIEATDEEAAGIKSLVAEMGSLEAAISTLEVLDEVDARRAA